MKSNFDSTLKNKYGHEENLSKAIANSKTLKDLLAKCGSEITEEASFEQKVEKGHKGHMGRIDIVQPTSSGIVIIEVQYGRSDNDHARRLENYASNYRKPAFVIWVAESFRLEHKNRFQHSKVPVLCARASLFEGNLILKQASPITWTKQTQTKRVKESNKKCQELMKRLFSNKYVKYKKLESFFQDEGSVRRNTSHIHWELTGKPKVKGWDLEGLVASIIDYYFYRLPKKTKFFVLKHPAFLEYKNDLKHKLKEYWEEVNKDNDHPYIDYTFLKESERKLVKKHDHISRVNAEGRIPAYEYQDKRGLELHRKYNWFAAKKYYTDWHPLVKGIGSRRLLELTEIEHLSGFKNKEDSIISYDKELQKQGDQLMAKFFSIKESEWRDLGLNRKIEACAFYNEIQKLFRKELSKISLVDSFESNHNYQQMQDHLNYELLNFYFFEQARYGKTTLIENKEFKLREFIPLLDRNYLLDNNHNSKNHYHQRKFSSEEYIANSNFYYHLRKNR